MKDHVFISYSHEDETWRVDLETHLTPFVRAGSVTTWSDQQIGPGSEWEVAINTALTNTRIAVLLVSPSFFASDFIHENELGPLLKRAEEGGVKILWIPVRHSSYEETPLKKYQALCNPAKPLAVIRRAKRDKVWVEICKQIKNEVSAIVAAPDVTGESAEIERNRETDPITTTHPGEPELTPTVTPVAETAPPAPTSLSSGQRAIANAAARVAAQRQRQNAQIAALSQQRLSRAETRKASFGIIRAIFDTLWDQIRAASDDVERIQGNFEPSLLLQWGEADLRFTPINVDTHTFSQSKWDVLNGYYISLSQPEPPYNWNGNLFLVQRPQDESFCWYEVAYFESPLIQRTRPAPFGVRNADEYRIADEVAAGVVGTWQLAYDHPIPIEGDHEQSFHDRWMERFAEAALGTLREPHLPLTLAAPRPRPDERVSNLVAAASVAIALSEERQALLEQAATDRRAAMKNSWEGLAKDILIAANIERGRLDPDSPAIGHALQRLHHSTHYAAGLVAELTQLHTTARTLFNQSKWAYDPQDAEARQYILRCEVARRSLRQTE